MTAKIRNFARVATAALLLLTPLSGNPARAEHGLEELKAEYTKRCEEATALAIVALAIVDQLDKGEKKLRENCSMKAHVASPDWKSEYCFKLQKELNDLNNKAQYVLQNTKRARDACERAQAAYSQALTEAALTKFLSGEAGSEETVEFVRKKIGKKKTVKKKPAKRKTTTKKTVRKPPKPKHSSSASAAVGIAVIGIIGGYLDGKSSRKKSSRTPGRRRSGGTKKCPRGDCR